MSGSRSRVRSIVTPGVAAALGLCGVALAIYPPGLNPFGPAKLVATMVFASLACVAVALDESAQARVRRAAQSRVVWATGALVLLAVLSLVTAGDVRLAMVGAYPNYTGLLAAFAWVAIAVAAIASDPEDLRRTCGRFGVVTLVLVGVYAALQRLGIDPMPASAAFDSGRAAATLGNASNLGVFLALVLPLAADRALHDTERVWRMSGWLALVLGAAAAGFSGSRGAWIALGVGAAVFAALQPRSRNRLWFASAVVVGVLLVSIALTPVSATRVTGGGTASATATGRLAVWSSTVPMIAERPFLGWGPAGFGRAHTMFATSAEVDPRGRVEALDDPHNIALSIAASTGIPGAVAALAIISFAGAALLRVRSTSQAQLGAALGGSLAGALAALQFHFVTLDTGAALAVVLGAVVGLSLHESRDEHASPTVRHALVLVAVGFGMLAVLATGGAAADAQVRQGFDRARRGQWSMASRAFSAAGSLASWEPAFKWAAGRAAIDAIPSDPSALRDGENMLMAASRRMPGDSRPLRDLGDLYVAASTLNAAEDWELALQAYDAALGLAPGDPRAWLGRGAALAGAGDLGGAQESMRRSVELAPRFAIAWENLAAVYDAEGNLEAAGEARARAAAAGE